MGNIRSTYIKRVAIELVEQYPEEFNGDYENNKKKVMDLTDIETMHMRNKVAGYITTYRKKIN